MNVALKLITNHEYTQAMAASWDWKQQNQDSLEGYINIILQQQNKTRIGWWIIQDEQPAGFFNIVKPKDHPEHATGTFIHHPYRNTFLHQEIKHAAIKAFQTMNLPLISSIQETNIRSIKATEKITKLEGELQWEENLQRYAYIYQLTNFTPENYNTAVCDTILIQEANIRNLR